MPNVTLRKGPHGIAVVIVDPPYEFLGEVLTVEGSWVFTTIEAAVQSIQIGDEGEFHQTGNAHTVHITPQSVTFVSHYRTPPAECVISLQDFQTLAEQWKALVRKKRRK
jgi:hypothetical protein